MPPLPSGEPGDRRGEDADNDVDDEVEFRPPLPAEDRIWRHPSEVAAAATPAPPLSRTRWGGRNRALGLVTVSGLVGATLSLGLLALFGGLGGKTTVVERNVAIQPVTSSASRGDTVAAVTARAAPAVAAVRVMRDGEAAAGSALVLRSDGYLVTSAHLVADATTIDVRFHDGAGAVAVVIGTDPVTDLAILRVDGAELSPAALGTAELLAVGDDVVAVGTASRGAWSTEISTAIVRGVARKVRAPDGSILHDMIVVDAPLDGAGGGGPLLDLHGAVVGLTTDVTTGSDAGRSYGVALPIDVVAHVADQIIEHGRARHVWLGVEGSDLAAAEAIALGVDGGASIVGVVEGGPAAEGGLLAGDVVVEVDGETVDSMSHLIAALRDHEPGDRVVLTVRRGDEVTTVDVTLGERQI